MQILWRAHHRSRVHLQELDPALRAEEENRVLRQQPARQSKHQEDIERTRGHETERHHQVMRCAKRG